MKNINIDVNLLPYPDGIGNNGDKDIKGVPHGCVICEWILNNTELCEPLPFESILRESSKNEMFLNMCEQSPHCGKLLRKFKEGTYKAKYNGGQGYDDISVGLINSKYIVYEGKHRVCVAKRFGIKSLPVILHE